MDFVPGAVAGVDEAELEAMAAKPLDELPGLFASCLPFALPVLMIAGASTVAAVLGKEAVPAWVTVLGDQNFVFLIGAVFAVRLVVRQNRIAAAATMKLLEPAIASGAVIAFITCAGGAFGKVLTASGVGEVIEHAAVDWGIGLLSMGFLAGMLFRIAQGSATVAMITVAGMVAPAMASMDLPYHPMYLMFAIGLGSMGFSWMNDSGFWLFGQLTGLSEVQTLKTWSAASCIMAIVGFAWVFLLTRILPLV